MPGHLTYAHCTHATAHKGDVAPYTSYEFRTVEFKMYRIEHLLATEDGERSTFEVEVDGTTIGHGWTKEEAIGDARYNLMARSRDHAYAVAPITPAPAV